MADHGYGKIDGDNISEINAPTERNTSHEFRVAKYVFDANLVKNQSINKIVSAAAVVAAGVSTIAAQPDGLNPLQYSYIVSGGSVTAAVVTVVGTDATGATVTEVVNFNQGSGVAALILGSVIFATVTSITTSGLVGTPSSDTLSVQNAHLCAGDPLPAGATVVRGFYDSPAGGGVGGILTSGGSAQISIGLNIAFADLKAAAVLGTNATVGPLDTLSTGLVAAFQKKLLKPTQPTVNVTAAALTGGRFYLFLEYVVSDS
jgi:hypothetical protein